MSQCVVWVPAVEIWGDGVGDLRVGSRFTSGLWFDDVRRIARPSDALSQAAVRRIAESGLMHVSATMDRWVEEGSRLNTKSELGVSIFGSVGDADFASTPTSSTPYVGEVALTFAPSGRWAGLRSWEHLVPEVQEWTVEEIFAFRSPGAPHAFWLDDWERRETVDAVDIDVFGPDDNCALVISRSSGNGLGEPAISDHV